MKKYWWKWLCSALLVFAIAGGLYVPLKTGITGVRLKHGDSLKMVSGRATQVEIDFYNYGENLDIKKVILLRDSSHVSGENILWDSSGTLTCSFKPEFGANGDRYSGLYSVYAFANEQWMAFPFALSITYSTTDTGKSNIEVLNNIEQTDPDLLPGFPNRPILNESIRNLLYHVPMWFSMIFVLTLSAWYSVKYLSKGLIDFDLRSDSLVKIGLLAGILGCLTGSFWARVTWDQWWPRDPKLNGVAIGMVMYFAYLLLRSGIKDEHQKARVSAVYNLFVFPIFIALIIIMPKLSGDSLHPGAGGTVTFKQYDLDNRLRMFFYPAVAGWIMFFTWMGSLSYRLKKLELNTTDE